MTNWTQGFASAFVMVTCLSASLAAPHGCFPTNAGWGCCPTPWNLLSPRWCGTTQSNKLVSLAPAKLEGVEISVFNGQQKTVTDQVKFTYCQSWSHNSPWPYGPLESFLNAAWTLMGWFIYFFSYQRMNKNIKSVVGTVGRGCGSALKWYSPSAGWR